MLAVKNFFLPERKGPDTQKFSRMPESFLRSIKRRSLRVKRTKSLVVVEREKRKSGRWIKITFFFIHNSQIKPVEVVGLELISFDYHCWCVYIYDACVYIHLTCGWEMIISLFLLKLESRFYFGLTSFIIRKTVKFQKR